MVASDRTSKAVADLEESEREMVRSRRAVRGRRLPLLSAMARDLDRRGRLRTRTAATMWAGYVGHALLTLWSLRRRRQGPPIPMTGGHLVGAVVAAVGTVLVAAGTGLCVAGMGRFTGPGELSGTRNQDLVTTGVYRYSRNPQYLGYLLALIGAALVRRSGPALASGVGLAIVYEVWTGVEEKHLARLYGSSYSDYMRRTRRWWGRRQT